MVVPGLVGGHCASFVAGPAGRRTEIALARALEIVELRKHRGTPCLSKTVARHQRILLVGCESEAKAGNGLGYSRTTRLRMGLGSGEVWSRLAQSRSLLYCRYHPKCPFERVVCFRGGPAIGRRSERRLIGAITLNSFDRA